ncbi:MAG: hypothetical protein IPP07_21560 [Holophagales bacterium]|jgi:hypothetical protein|nr:hypothetical protein [Holophagales bacterium]MBK9967318.1 hypothetical protein [Holophagales bacterium]
MKRFASTLAVLALAAAPAFAGDKTYQVTGPVVSVTDTVIVVDKAGEKFEIARTKDTKVTGELKAGTKVTVKYTMTATTIEAKEEKAPAKKK